MKRKLFLAVLCTIGLCLIVACNMDSGTTTASAARSLDTGAESGQTVAENLYTGLDESEQ